MENQKPWEGFKLHRLPNMQKDKETLNFQDYTIYRALESDRYLIGLGTGLGKTLCSYCVYEYYKSEYPRTKLIIVTNNSAVFQFRNEYSKFFESEMNLVPIHSKVKGNYRKYRQKMYNDFESGDIDGLVLNYHILVNDLDYIKSIVNKMKKSGQHTFVILDEASSFKNQKTQRYKAVKFLSNNVDKIVALTATLIKGKLEEAYGIYSGLGIQLSKTKETFYKEFCVYWQHPKYFYIKNITGYKNVDEFNRRIEPYTTIINKSEVSNVLPRFTRCMSKVSTDDIQNKLILNIYNGYLREEDVDIDDEDSYIAKITEQGHIRRALLDPTIVLKPEDIPDYKTSPKTEELVRMLEDDFYNEKIVVYSQSKKYIKMLGKLIKKNKNIPDQYKNIGYIHGDIKTVDREEIKQKFQETDEINLILMTDAGTEAINLQSASVLIVMNIPSTAGDFVQLAGRLSRIGSKHQNLLVHFILADNSQDEDDYLIMQQQLGLMSNVMGEQEQGLVDWDMLMNKDRFCKESMSLEDFKEQNKARMIFAKRQKRKQHYEELVGV